MAELVDAIRAALEPEASAEARAAGAAACRSLLAALAPEQPQQQQQPLVSPEAVTQLATLLRGMDLDQLFDVAIAKLRALESARPGSTPVAAPRAFTYLKVPVPQPK